MSTSNVKPKAMIQDNTRCIGCRACMVACKSWNDRPADHTDFFAGDGYQNPRDLDANNYTLITFNEIVTGAQPDWVFGRQLCMHCEHPACASACRACMVACKSWNDRPADHTDFFAGDGYQNPRDLDANNY